MRRSVIAVVVVGLFGLTAVQARAEQAPAPLDCANWRYGAADEPAPGTLPAEFDRNGYKRTSLRDPALATSPHHLCGQKGAAVDLAWGVTKGDPAARIAVLDSGIKWRDAGDMADLADKAYVNVGEARPPCIAAHPDGDCNGDGRVSIVDFGPIADRNGNGLADPEDLILDPHFSNGRDDDHNGYVDDISGWDFLYGDNNPLDTVAYGHGTGEAGDSAAAENGRGDVGTCPRCTFIPVRVGDSFIADGGRFAAGVLFGLDSGAAVIQEALGALNNPRQAQEAVDAAYRRGVPVVASMADEASKHPNLPAALEHTLAVNSVRSTSSPVGYLALNGCTNFGGHTFVSVPSSSCSSEATGISSGIVGLLVSEARAKGLRLTTNEVLQLVGQTADDVDFSTPNAVDPANDVTLGAGAQRYPTTPGWDATNGYGRINAYEIVKSVRDGRVPPEADLTSPRWFRVYPATGSMHVRGRVAADRARSFSYRVEWAPGLQPPAYPGTDAWHVVASRSGLHGAVDGELVTIDLASIASALPDHGRGAPADPTTGRSDEERFSVRVRVVVTAAGGASDGLAGVSQKQVFVHDDPGLVNGFPRRVRGAGTSSPVFANLDGRPGDELLLATDDGRIRAYRADGTDLPGWPVRSDRVRYWREDSRAAEQNDVNTPRGAFMVGAPVVADLNHDGRPEVADADLEGNVYVWDATGHRLAHMRTDPRFSLDWVGAQDEHNRTQPGFAGALAAADLDGDGRLELIGAALDRHVYAWHADGTPVAGFPVLLVDPAKLQAVNPITHTVTFRSDAAVDDGGELVATPAVADLDGDGYPEIVVGAQEEYDEPMNAAEFAGVAGTSGNSRVYAISPRGRLATNPNPNPAHPDAQAYLPGWPGKIGMFQRGVLPTIGDGVSAQAAIGDLIPTHPGVEVAVSAAVGPIYVLGADGRSALGQVDGRDRPLKWFGGLFANDPTGFGVQRNSNDLGLVLAAFGGPSVGHLGARDRPDVASVTAGLGRLLDTTQPELQLPSDDQLMGWDPVTGLARPGFPRETPDLAFFVTPAIADVNGDGHNEVIAGNGVYTLSAVAADGSVPAGWPKLTGGWLVGTPALGDWNGDGRAELAVVRRDGVLIVWRTPTAASALTEWPRFGRDGTNGARLR